MADELTLSVYALFQKSPATAEEIGFGSVSIDVSGDQINKPVITATTSPAAIPIGAIGTLGHIIGRNLSTTHAVHFRNGSGGTNFMTVPAGGVFLLPVASGVTLYCLTSSSTADVQYLAVEA